jgi:mortality factor 4-like protein 1
MPSRFQAEQKVLAFHGPLIHEAKVLEACAKDAPDGKTKVQLYLLRYDGWSSHWDEWVPESRVLENNDENLKRQKERVKEFSRAHKRKREAAAKDAQAKAAKPGGSAAGKSGAGGPDESLCAEIRDHLRLPHGVKLKLIEDWERISREKKLAPLPRNPSIATLLEDFQMAKARRTSHERLYGEVCDGVRAYFNQALPTILLYKFERRQHREAKENHRTQQPVEYYGAEHLLRLFVKLPELLARCNMQKEHLTVLVSKLAELLKFIISNKAKYLSAEYEVPSEDYLAWWGNGEVA